MYQIVICDDEPIFANELKDMVCDILREFGAEFNIIVCMNADSLLKVFEDEKKEVHIILLDIILEKVNGVELAKYLRNKGFKSSILFITSTKDYSLEGYSVYPIHYLVKPVQRKILYDILYKDYNDRFLSKHIILPSNSEYQVLLIDDIFFIEMLNRKIIVHTISGNIEYTKSLKDILLNLPEKLFVQCHKSFIVNMIKVVRFSKTKFILTNGLEVPVGRVFYKDAISKFISYLDDT